MEMIGSMQVAADVPSWNSCAVCAPAVVLVRVMYLIMVDVAEGTVYRVPDDVVSCPWANFLYVSAMLASY
jgi:hypothetical protein